MKKIEVMRSDFRFQSEFIVADKVSQLLVNARPTANKVVSVASNMSWKVIIDANNVS